jgi:hypothetical protein
MSHVGYSRIILFLHWILIWRDSAPFILFSDLFLRSFISTLFHGSIPFNFNLLRDSLDKVLYTFFGIIRKLRSFYTFYILSVLKISPISYRIFEYTTFSGEILLSHNTVKELCYVAGFVDIIVT